MKVRESPESTRFIIWGPSLWMQNLKDKKQAVVCFLLNQNNKVQNINSHLNPTLEYKSFFSHMSSYILVLTCIDSNELIYR